MTKSNFNSTVATIITTALTVGSISSIGWWYYYAHQEKRKIHSARTQKKCNQTSSFSNFSSEKFKPPFPQTIRDLLSKSRLAYLSTVDAEMSSSHLSLMRFTYLLDEEDGEVVIMSTNRKTKKFEMLQEQKGVALLIHDFISSGEDDGSTGGGMYSITLNGNCRILENGSGSAEKYRQAHLKHNPDYPQFIVGEDIIMLCVDVTSARICDVRDQVIKWNVHDVIDDSNHFQ